MMLATHAHADTDVPPQLTAQLLWSRLNAPHIQAERYEQAAIYFQKGMITRAQEALHIEPAFTTNMPHTYAFTYATPAAACCCAREESLRHGRLMPLPRRADARRCRPRGRLYDAAVYFRRRRHRKKEATPGRQRMRTPAPPPTTNYHIGPHAGRSIYHARWR